MSNQKNLLPIEISAGDSAHFAVDRLKEALKQNGVLNIGVTSS